MKTITVNELKERLQQNQIVLIDVREMGEYRSGYIDGSILLPLGQISVDKLPTKSKPLVLYCHAGTRSQKACEKLLAQDPNLEIYNLQGGIVAWENACYEVKKLESQRNISGSRVYVILGLLSIVAIGLGVLVNNWT